MYSISLISLSINLNSKHFLRIKPYQSTYYPRTRPFLAIKSPLSPLISLSWSKSKSIVGERDPEQTVKPQTFHIPDSRTNLRDACDVLTEEEQSARTTMAWRRAFEASMVVSDFDSLRWSFTDRQTRLRHSIPGSWLSLYACLRVACLVFLNFHGN